MSTGERDLTVAQRISFSMPQIGLNISGTIMGSWLMFFFLPPDDEISAGRVALVSAGIFAALDLYGRIVDALADPFVGYWSDRTRSKLGRRMPFILYGTPLLIVSYIALWFPPFEPESAGNSIYLAGVLTAYWILFTVVVGPYSALLPEVVTSTKGRVVLSSVMALFVGVGSILGFGSGALISAFPHGATILGVEIGSGIQLVAVIGGLTMLLMLVPLWNIRETPHSERKEVDIGFVEGVTSALKNPAFLPVVGVAALMLLALNMVAAVMPYLTTQVLERPVGGTGLVAPGEGEAWQTWLMVVVFAGALLWIPFINKLVQRVSRKKLMMLAGVCFSLALFLWPVLALFDDPAVPALLLMGGLTFPAAVALVLPPVLYADAIDYDETLTGFRREGIYNGASATVVKTAQGLSRPIAVAILAGLGNSRSEPTGIYVVGPVAGVIILLGVYVFRNFPQEKIEAAVATLREQRAAGPASDD